MQSTVPVPPLSVSPASLAAAFGDMPDLRRMASIRYPLPAILAMTVAAILTNHVSVLAISEWAARQPEPTLTALGFPTMQTLCQSTLQRLFAKRDGIALGQVLAAAVAPAAVPTTGLQGVAIDGKAQRGRLRFADDGGPVHALSAYCHQAGLVLAQESIAVPADADRGEAELSVAPLLLDRIDWKDRVLTGDAVFCQRTLCQQVLDADGDYLLTVKQNQPQLWTDIALLFEPPADSLARPLVDRRAAETLDYGHGRILDRRVLVASTDLVGDLDWPGHAQVLRIARTWRDHDTPKRAVRYAITSLTPERADAAQVLALTRVHWAIENHLHRCKDVNLAEDASLVHAGQGPHVMTRLRDAAVRILHAAGVSRIAAQLRSSSQHPEQAVALVLGARTTHA